MLLAQLHRKVPSDFEGMEDVLTSSVFGLLKYLPDELARKLLAKFADISVPRGPLYLQLWPRYPTPPGFRSPALPAEQEEEPVRRGDTEPDAVITAGDWLVLMEAKYRSPLDEDYDQLGREFAVGYCLAQDRGYRFRLLVVTGHTLRPKPAGLDLVSGVQDALRAASAGLGDAAADMIATVPDSLHWTNWQSLYGIFRTAHDNQRNPNHIRQLLGDVCQLLELRGLRPYDSRSIARALAKWEGAGIPDKVWSLPVAYRYCTASYASAGWEQLLRLDTTILHPLAWHLRTRSKYDLAQLGRFQLSSLSTPMWYPFH